MGSTVILCCEVFNRELEALRKKGLLPEGWTVESFEIGLHDHPPLLKGTLQAEIDLLESSSSPDRILLAYGHCGGGLEGLKAQNATLILPLAHDCISVLLGSVSRHREILKSHPKSFFSTAGWLKGGKLPGPGRERDLRERYAEMDEDVLEDLVEADQSTYASYNRLTHVATEITPAEELEEASRCSSSMNWELKVEKGSLGWLSDLLKGDLSPDKFLVAKPGENLCFPSSFFSH